MVPVSNRAQYVLEEYQGRFAFSWERVVAARESYPPPQLTDAVWLYVNGGEVTQVVTPTWDRDNEAYGSDSPFHPWGPVVIEAIDPSNRYAPTPWGGGDGAFGWWENPEHSEDGQGTGTFGSGCSPGDVDSLPDGAWAGIVTELQEDAVVIDLVCWWKRDSTQYQEAMDWCAEEYGENDTFCFLTAGITNDTSRLRENPLADGALFLTQGGIGSPQDTTAGFLLSVLAGVPGEFLPNLIYGNTYWIYINDGEVTFIVQRWEP